MTPRAASYSVSEPFNVRAGSSMRRVIDFSDFDNGFSILPTGQSDYLDQNTMMIKLTNTIMENLNRSCSIMMLLTKQNLLK